MSFTYHGKVPRAKRYELVLKSVRFFIHEGRARGEQRAGPECHYEDAISVDVHPMSVCPWIDYCQPSDVINPSWLSRYIVVGSCLCDSEKTAFQQTVNTLNLPKK